MEENKVTQIDEGRSFITKPSALTNDDIQHKYRIVRVNVTTTEGR